MAKLVYKMPEDQMQVREFGLGPTIVLIHGTVPSDSLVPLAKELSDDFRVLLPDLPGYRGTDPLDPDGLQERREALEAVIDQWTDCAQVALVGHSFGSYQAFDLALAGEVSVGAIVALGPIAGLADEEREQFRGFAQALRAGQDLTDVALQRWFAPDYLEAHPEMRDKVGDWLQDAGLPGDLDLVAQAPVILERLGLITAPAYLRVGALDQATPPELARDIHQHLSNATLDVVDDVGHMLAQEDLEETAEAITDFLLGARRTDILEVADIVLEE